VSETCEPAVLPDAAGQGVGADRGALAGIASSPHISIVLVDTFMRYRAVLGEAPRMHGYDPDDLLGRAVADVLSPALFARIGPNFTRALAGGTVVDVAESSDGTAVYETTYSPTTEAGRVVGAVALVRDVTVEQRALAELAATDERHQLLVNHISDAMVFTSPRGVFKWVSPSVENVLGWKASDLTGRTVLEFVHDDDLAEVRVRREHFFATGEPVTVTHRFRRPDGDWTWVESNLRAVHDPGSGEVVTAVVTVRDITARLALEAELSQALEMFEKSFAAAPIGKALVAPDGRFIRVNTALCALLGRDDATIRAMTFQELTHPDDLAADVDLLDEIARGERESYRIEKRYLRPDGSPVWSLLAVSVVRDAAGGPQFYISQIEDISERKKALREMERLATIDTLTGLPNRLLLMDRLRHALEQCRRGGWMVGVLFVDLDHFKQVNDTFGHEAGDELLRQAAERLSATVQQGDTTTRLGGDEFVIVCEQVTGLDEVTAIAEHLRAELARPFTVFGHDLQISASIGVTTGSSGSGEALLREADRAMYAAKRDRPNRIDVYSEALEVVAHDQLRMHAALRVGLGRDELTVHYQPIVDLSTGRLVAREALVRWIHPTLGLLAPARFLDGTDRTQLGILLGEKVLAQACAQAACWPDDVGVHVNVSARHLAQADFPRSVADHLGESGLAPDRLVLEITESLVLAASDSTLTSAEALRGLGVGLSLDDFGTGYSSLAALNRLPIDSFKIDRSFIADSVVNPTSAALVEGLISLGSHMDLDVIAEGIETEQQAEWLTTRGCPHGQGYFFGRPMPEPA
jgi:diguanylate cyclase (GGDEF)-like protein/PAS domain S-box-containing protein